MAVIKSKPSPQSLVSVCAHITSCAERCRLDGNKLCLTHFFNLTPCWAPAPPYLDVWSKLLLTRERNVSHWGTVATEIAAKLPPFLPNHLPGTISPVWRPEKILSKEAKWVNVSPGGQVTRPDAVNWIQLLSTLETFWKAWLWGSW